MELAAWIRERLWRATGWSQELARMHRELVQTPTPTARTVDRMWELACATEYVDADRGRVLAVYLDAWRGGHPYARAAVVQLAGELRAHVTLAEVAIADHAESKDPVDLLAAGRSYLDAGLPELAAEPLAKAGEAAHAEVKPLLAIARHGKVDVEKVVGEAASAAAGEATADAAAGHYLHALRVARAAGNEALVGATLALAARRCPDDPEIAALVEDRVIERGSSDDILHHFRARFDRAKGLGTWVTAVRAAAARLVVREAHRGLGLRLLRMSLEHAYASGLPDIANHIAAWEMLVAHARGAKTTRELAPLVVSALALPRSADDTMYLSLLGLEIAWKDAGDTLAAQPFAATVAEAARDNPLAAAFIAEVMPELMPKRPAPAPEQVPAAARAHRVAMPKLEAPPRPSEDTTYSSKREATGTLPKVTFATGGSTATSASAPTATSASPATSATSQTPSPAATSTTTRVAVVSSTDVRATGKMPAISAGALAAARAAARAPEQGKVEPVRIPTQAIRALKRNTSRIPAAAPVPATAQPRAPRRVLPIDVMIKLPDGTFFPTMLRDVSTSGAFVVTARAIAAGAVVTLDLRLPTRDPLVQSPHRTTARIARLTEAGWGLAFVDPSPVLVAAIEAAITPWIADPPK